MPLLRHTMHFIGGILYMKPQRIILLLSVITCLALAARPCGAQEVAGVTSAESSRTDALPARPVPRSVIPDPTPDYVRPTEMQKLHAFAFHAVGPYAIALAIAGGGIDQVSNAPPEWGGGVGSFGERVASNFGIQLATVTADYGLAEIVREDVIYYPCDCTGLLHRFSHAMISTVTARRGEDGHTTLSFAGIVSPYAGTMTALAWYPSRFGVKDGFRMGNYNLLDQAAKNLAFEFIYGGPHALLGRNHVSSFGSP